MNIPIHHGRITGRTTFAVVCTAPTPLILHPIEVACAKEWHIHPHQLHVRRRSEHISHPRMLAMKLLVEREGWTHSQASEHFGLNCHGTSLSASRRVDELTAGDKRFAAKRQAVERAL